MPSCLWPKGRSAFAPDLHPTPWAAESAVWQRYPSDNDVQTAGGGAAAYVVIVEIAGSQMFGHRVFGEAAARHSPRLASPRLAQHSAARLPLPPASGRLLAVGRPCCDEACCATSAPGLQHCAARVPSVCAGFSLRRTRRSRAPCVRQTYKIRIGGRMAGLNAAGRERNIRRRSHLRPP